MRGAKKLHRWLISDDSTSGYNHFHLLDLYYNNQETIQGLMESVMTSLNGVAILTDMQSKQSMVNHLSKFYPYVELIYSLDKDGIQRQEVSYSPTVEEVKSRPFGVGTDRSERPYAVEARANPDKVIVTKPYLSSATNKLAISTARLYLDEAGEPLGYLVVNFNLQKLMTYLNGDASRIRYHRYFRWTYSIIGCMLILVAAMLLYSGLASFIQVFTDGINVATGAFGIVIMITLGMSIFDLGKTILEEEVLVDKNIQQNDSTRRTISRFMAAIIIAVSIEALLLMFKTIFDGGDNSQLLASVWMLLASVAMLTGLGVYMRLSRED